MKKNQKIKNKNKFEKNNTKISLIMLDMLKKLQRQKKKEEIYCKFPNQKKYWKRN